MYMYVYIYIYICVCVRVCVCANYAVQWFGAVRRLTALNIQWFGGSGSARDIQAMDT